MTTEGFHRFCFMFGRGGWGEGCSAATCNFTTRCHYILHTEPLSNLSLWHVKLYESFLCGWSVHLPPQSLQTPSPSALPITLGRCSRGVTTPCGVRCRAWLLWDASPWPSTRDSRLWVNCSPTTRRRSQWLRSSLWILPPVKKIMELSTGVKPSWNWDQTDHSTLQWRHHKNSMPRSSVREAASKINYGLKMDYFLSTRFIFSTLFLPSSFSQLVQTSSVHRSCRWERGRVWPVRWEGTPRRRSSGSGTDRRSPCPLTRAESMLGNTPPWQ